MLLFLWLLVLLTNWFIIHSINCENTVCLALDFVLFPAIYNHKKTDTKYIKMNQFLASFPIFYAWKHQKTRGGNIGQRI